MVIVEEEEEDEEDDCSSAKVGSGKGVGVVMAAVTGGADGCAVRGEKDLSSSGTA